MPDFELVSDFAPTGDQLEDTLHSVEGHETVKLQRLESLRARIIQEMCVRDWKDVWFFPEHKGVLGWKGTQDIMFVGLNPSTGSSWYPGDADDRFDKSLGFLYDQLKKNGLQNAHLTDAIKCRGTRGQAEKWRENLRNGKDDEFLQQQLGYLREEINIVAPLLIVPMGRDCCELLKRYLGSVMAERVKIELPHYAQRFENKKTKLKFVDGMREVRQCYDARVRGS